jgi:PKD repeat protein
MLTRPIIVAGEPTAKLNVTPTVVYTYETIVFNATASHGDFDIPLSYYLVDFGDGNLTGWITSPIITYNYTDDGTYNATLIVMDVRGVISQRSENVTIIVLNREPIAHFTIDPLEGNVTTWFKFIPENAYDPDGTITKYFWNFGDSTTIELTIDDDDTDILDINQTHRFRDDLSYEICLIVQDDDGANSTQFIITLPIENLPPTAKARSNRTEVYVNESILFFANETTDPDDTIDALNYTWLFSNTADNVRTHISYGLTVIYAFSLPGNYTVTLQVTDDNNATSYSMLLITVHKLPAQPPIHEEREEVIREIVGDEFIWLLVVVIIVPIVVVAIGIGLYFRKRIRQARARRDIVIDKRLRTVGRLDFVILRKGIRVKFKKFEFHAISGTPGKYMGIIWRSGRKTEWEIDDTIVATRDEVIRTLCDTIYAYLRKGWAVDYYGNGAIIGRARALGTGLR